MAMKLKKWILRLLAAVCLIAIVLLLLPKHEQTPPRDPIPQAQYSLRALGSYVDTGSFISADMLQGFLGEFDTFAFQEARRKISPEAYAYRYKDDTLIVTAENYADLYIEKLPTSGTAPLGVSNVPSTAALPASDLDPRDLRRAPHNGIYRLGKLTYYYNDHYDPNGGLLNYIHWNAAGFSFTLALNGFAMDTFDLQDGSFISRLLSEETAEQAVAQFDRKISLTLALRKFLTSWLPLLALATTAVMALYFLHKMRAFNRALDKLTTYEEPEASPGPGAQTQFDLLGDFETLCSKK